MSTAGLDGSDLPDVETLTRLANEFFLALPGKAPARAGDVNPVPVASSVPTQPGAQSSVSAAKIDHSLTGGSPTAPDAAPFATGTTPAAFSAIPVATPINPLSYVANPLAFTSNPLPMSVPGEAELRGVLAPSGLESHAAAQPVQTLASANPMAQTANPFVISIPGESELRALLTPAGVTSREAAFASLSSAPGPSFYFLETAASGPAGIHVPSFEPDRIPLSFGPSSPPFDVNLARRDFPILQEQVNGRPLIWLDNAATTQKPQSVIDRLKYFYEHENSNIHRAAHEMAARATEAYEAARDKVRGFLNASSANEIVFVRGATEAINLVAQSWGRQSIGKDDEIIVSWLEHHANIVPWQQLCAQTGAKLLVIPVDDNGEVLLEEYGKLLGPSTKLVSFTQVSNALGTITPAQQMIEMAHAAGAKVLLDGAQSVSHMRVDVQGLNCDWFVFSGHKVFAPTGIGVLYGKQELLNDMPPWQGGGNMIEDVTFERTRYQQPPARFEAGTGNIADAVGLGAAIDYVNSIGIDLIGQYEHQLLVYMTRLLKEVPGLHIIAERAQRAGVLSFVLDGHKTETVGSSLNREGIAVRSGHHCAQPILRRFGQESSVRPSLALYNTCDDIDALVAALHRLAQRPTGF
jgi:cysteine desulfurase / selenocysteine lyase